MFHPIPLPYTRRIFNLLDSLTLEPTLFDDAEIDSRINRQTMTNAIIMRCGTLQPIYIDTRTFKIMINTFFATKKRTITKLLDSEMFEYNPIENYNMREKVVDSHTGTDTQEFGHVLDTKYTPNLNSKQVNTPNTVVEETVSAFNSGGYSPAKKSAHSGTDTTENNQTGNATNNETNSGNDKTIYDNTHTVNTERSGNIGVTTSQQMIEQERKVAVFSVYEWIAVEFENEFFICAT